MTHILSILRAAHCRSTHHYFALDSLQHMRTAQAQRLANILLKYHDDYLIGAKAPDSNFKDFQNHVVHVSANNWGGAPQKCDEWLSRTREYLDQGNWKKAAYACGVLSHYFTDPIMPLHTAQTDRELVIHRPLEWSVCQSYEEIYKLSIDSEYACDFELSQDPQWISKAVLAAATLAHRYYDRLVSIYDLDRGVAVPRQGLNDEAMTILAELFSIAIHGWSSVLTRLADETTSELPQVSLTMTSLLATIDMPLAWVVRKISNSHEKRAVAALFKEYQKTGTLKRHLPPEIVVVREKQISEPNLGVRHAAPSINTVGPVSQHAVDVENRNLERRTAETSILARRDIAHLTAAIQSEATETDSHKSVAPADGPRNAELETPASHTVASQNTLEADQLLAEPLQSADWETADKDEKKLAVFDGPQATTDSQEENAPQFVSLSQARSRKRIPLDERTPSSVHSDLQNARPIDLPTNQDNEVRSTLRIAPGTLLPGPELEHSAVHYDSNVVDAPSIGPKTAKRLESIGITTIRQLISTSSESIVEGLATRWITQNLVQDWQDQARLVCEVPALTGYRAQLLVAIGCRTSWQLRTANPATLHSQVSQFGQTSEGQQILRSARTPEIADVLKWIESARSFARREVA